MGRKGILNQAYEYFENGVYDKALECFVRAYDMGIDREWILENVYNCYVNGNDEEFRSAYSNNGGDYYLSYDECIFDFVPLRDGEYYIFDKEKKVFKGLFSISGIKQSPIEDNLIHLEFSPVALVIDWNWTNISSVIKTATGRTIYTVCKDMKRAVSFWKIPEFREYIENIYLFSNAEELDEYLHSNTGAYLPKLVYSEYEDDRIKITNTINKEHRYRIENQQGRNRENILLSIAIPTHARGNLLLKRLENLRKCIYDSEIEFVISKNGSSLYEEEYAQVNDIVDTRIIYSDCKEELYFADNWRKAVELSNGKYVLFVSDEDDVELDALEHYLELLKENESACVLRAATNTFYSDIPERTIYKMGTDSLIGSFVRQNYLSGLIVKRSDFLEENLGRLNVYKDILDYKYYPHEWWIANLVCRGDYIEEPLKLITVNDSVLREEQDKLLEMGTLATTERVENVELSQYATYESRLEQLQGLIVLLHLLESENKYDRAAIRNAIMKAFGKTCHLMLMAMDFNYKFDEFSEFVGNFEAECKKLAEEFDLKEQERKSVHNYIKVLTDDMLTEYNTKKNERKK